MEQQATVFSYYSTTSTGKQADTTQYEANEQKLSKSKNISSRARANEVLEKGNISFDNKLHCFMVKGTSGVLHAGIQVKFE